MSGRLGVDRRALQSAWVRLALSIRLLAGTTAVLLLAVHRVTNHDTALIVAGGAYVLATCSVAIAWPAAMRLPASWLLDSGTALSLVALSGDWRSPFYLLAVSTMVAPAAHLDRWRACSPASPSASPT